MRSLFICEDLQGLTILEGGSASECIDSMIRYTLDCRFIRTVTPLSVYEQARWEFRLAFVNWRIELVAESSSSHDEGKIR